MTTYTTAQICDIFHISKRTVHNWIESGLLSPIRINKQRGSKILFDADEIEAMLKPERKEA